MRVAGAGVEVLEALEHLRHGVANAVVVVGVVCQGVLLCGSVAWAIPARIAHSERSCGEPGSFIP